MSTTRVKHGPTSYSRPAGVEAMSFIRRTITSTSVIGAIGDESVQNVRDVDSRGDVELDVRLPRLVERVEELERGILY